MDGENDQEKAPAPASTVSFLPFPLDVNTLFTLKKGGFILSGTVTLSGSTATINDRRIKGISSPVVSLQSGSGASTFLGKIASGGTASTPFPSGWTVTSVGTGQYKVIHTMSSESYIVFPSVFATGRYSFWEQQSTGQFIIGIQDASGSFQDADVFFMVVPFSGIGGSISASCADGALTISGPSGAVVNYLIIL